MGVHNPAMRRIPAASKITDAIAIRISGLLSNLEPARATKAPPTTRRINRRPAPGQPSANVEYKRRKANFLRSLASQTTNALETPKGGRLVPLLRFRIAIHESQVVGKLQLDDSSFQSDRGSVGPVVSAQLGQDGLNASLDAFFGD